MTRNQISKRTKRASTLDIDEFLHPANAFQHPMQVARDPDLTLNEKRAILSSWASDACALEAANELRLHASGVKARWDDIMDALRSLDDQSHQPRTVYDPKQPWWRQTRLRFRRGGDQNSGAPA